MTKLEPLSARLAQFAMHCKHCDWPDDIVHMLGVAALQLEEYEDIKKIFRELGPKVAELEKEEHK